MVVTDEGPLSGSGALSSPRDVREMFGRITRRYDLVNRLMTGGMDVRWRREVARLAVAGQQDARVLDVATGTGDLAFAISAEGATAVIGVDFAVPMLRAAAAKRGERNVGLAAGDALRLPFADGSFHACTVAFGLRNMADYAAAIREMTRVLRPGGRLIILELTPYRRPVLGRLFGWYFGRLVPFIGGLLSGDRTAYAYLPRSVAAFPAAETLAALMRQSGLTDVTYRLRGLGTVAIHLGTKPAIVNPDKLVSN